MNDVTRDYCDTTKAFDAIPKRLLDEHGLIKVDGVTQGEAIVSKDALEGLQGGGLNGSDLYFLPDEATRIMRGNVEGVLPPSSATVAKGSIEDLAKRNSDLAEQLGRVRTQLEAGGVQYSGSGDLVFAEHERGKAI